MKTTTHKNQRKLIYLLLVSVLMLFACGPDTVTRVRITPTPDPAVAAVATQTAMSMPTASYTPTLTPSPSNTPTLTATATQTSPPTATNAPDEPTPTTPPTESGPGPTRIGPIIGQDYVRPTLPPPPTATDGPIFGGGDDTDATQDAPIIVNPIGTDTIGIQVYSQTTFEDFQRAIGDVERIGVKWVKIQANWAFLQPDGPNQLDRLELFERQVQLASRPEDTRVLLSIAKAPLWTRSVREEDGPPDNPQQLADFISLLLSTKIGENIDAIEVWNEPNLLREWRGTLPFNGDGYMQLFRPSYDVIRAASPNMPIVTAGLAPTSTLGNFAVDDRTFLQQMYNAGLTNYISDSNVVIGAHPYGWWHAPDARCCGDPNSAPGWDEDPHFYFIENLEAVRNIMVNNGHQNGQVWVTEFGWATWEGLPGPAPDGWLELLTARQQGEYNIRAFEIGQELPWVGPMFLWNLNFANETTVEQRNEIVGFSLIVPTFDVRERPGYWAVGRATGAIE